jgi:hypothetical protein
MKIIGILLLLGSGFLVGDVVVRNIRRFVVAARKGDAHANGMVMTYTFVGIIVSVVIMYLIGWLFACSPLWYFPTFTIIFLVNMRKQYKEENGTMDMPAVNHEFVNYLV